MSGSPGLPEHWNLDPSSEVICVSRAGCANGKMEPKCSKCHSHSHLPVPHCSKGHSPAIRDQECSVLRLGSDMTQIYLLLLRQSVQLITLMSPLKYKPHRSSFSQGFLCSAHHPSCSSCPSSGLATVSTGTPVPLANSPRYHHFSLSEC